MGDEESLIMEGVQESLQVGRFCSLVYLGSELIIKEAPSSQSWVPTEVQGPPTEIRSPKF